MKRTSRLKLAGLVAGLVAALGAGGAIAATQLSPGEESDAIIADAAKELGVDAEELDAALVQALENRIDEAVEAGTLTEAQAAELKERLAAGGVPLVGLGPGLGLGGPGLHHVLLDLGAAADYLGLSDEELHEALLDDGQTLADVADAEDKSVDGLVDALVAAARERLDAAVADGRLTDEQRTERLAELEASIRALVEDGFPRPPAFRDDFPGADMLPTPDPTA